MSNASDFFSLGGGGFPINAQIPLNYIDPVGNEVVVQGTETYLRSGFIEDVPSTYPEAEANLGIPNGDSFDVSGEDNDPASIQWDGAKFWITGDQTNTVYRYTAAGAYDSFSFSVGSSPHDITIKDSNLWISDLTADTVTEYTTGGTATGNSFSTAGETALPYGVVWDGTYFWVGAGDGFVYRYTAAGAYDTFSVDLGVTISGTIRSLTWDGDKYWVSTTNMVYRFKSDWSYDNFSFTVIGDGGMDKIGDVFHRVGLSTLLVYKYVPAVGIPEEKFNSDSGLPIYVKVKG